MTVSLLMHEHESISRLSDNGPKDVARMSQRLVYASFGQKCVHVNTVTVSITPKAIPPAQKTFDAEGEALEHALRKSFRLRNDAIKSLCSLVRRFRDATIKEECKGDYPQALQALWKALDRAVDLIQN